MKFLRRAYLILLCLLPAVLFFSYYPVISLGSNASTNFEFSLPLIWLVLFDLTVFFLVILLRKDLKFREKFHLKKFFKSAAGFATIFALYAAISVLWSPNHLRGFLTAGIISALLIAIFAIFGLTPHLHSTANFRYLVLKSFLVSSAIICLFCWLQCIFDLLGWQREATLLCYGCTNRSFGFPHPSGFAIEPQFMGNLLLAPTFTALYLLNPKLRKGHASSIYLASPREEQAATTERAPRKDGRANEMLNNRASMWLAALAFFFSATLFLTFSRGAIYAYAVGLAIFLVFALIRRFFHPSLILIPIISFIFALLAQGTFAALSPTSETFLGGITKSLHQLSLGVIDLRSVVQNTSISPPEVLEAPSDSNPSSGQALAETAPSKPQDSPNQPTFDGYIAESTDIRLNLNQAALDTWLSAPDHPESGLSIGLRCLSFCCPCTGSGSLTPTSIFFGVGLGGAGMAMYRNSFMTGVDSPKEIVQNQPLSLLLELGLVGCILVAFILFYLFRPCSPIWRSPAAPLLIPLCAAYFVTLQFFSGLPNALHIYLLPPLLYYIFKKVL